MFKSLISIYKKTSIVTQIVVGLIIGILLAWLVPEQASGVSILGEFFVKALKSVAPLLVFILVTSAIASHVSGTKTGLKSIILLYAVSTLIAAALATLASFLFPITIKFPETVDLTSAAASGSLVDILKNIFLGAVSNPVTAISEANYISILVWAIALGLMFKKTNQATKNVLFDLSHVVTEVVKLVIRLAPLGVMGLVFSSCTQEGGFGNLVQYGKLIALLVAVMFIVALITNPILVAITTKKNPFPLVWITLKESAYFAFFTRSSAANIPVNLNLCRRMNVPDTMSSISIPLGATVNMSGAAITISILTLAAANTLYGSDLDFTTALLLCFISAVGACGSSGMAGGSLMLIPLACSLFGIGNDIAMQMVAIGMVIGVIQDSCETALNSSSDALFTIAVSEREKQKETKANKEA